MDPRVVAILHDAFKKGMEEPSYIAGGMNKFDQGPFYLNSADYQAYALRTLAEQNSDRPRVGPVLDRAAAFYL